MSSQPFPLFNDDPAEGAAGPPPARRTLVVHAKPGQPLDKKQRAFNRLLARVEALRAQLDDRRRLLDETLVFHAAHVAPRVRQAIDLRTQAIRALRPFLHDTRLRAADRRLLAGFVARQIDDVFTHDQAPDADLQELFEELHGLSVHEAAQGQIDQTRAEMAEFFASLGMDVEIPEMRAGMTDEEMAASTAGFLEEMERELEGAVAREENTPPRPKTKRDLREEARERRVEEARRNSLGVVYRRLARALHPDLERDPAAREQKSALMQQVTAAHAANDLHTLLRLEVEVMHGDASDATKLTVDTLEAYTEMLKQQAADLEAARLELLLHPRYRDVVASGPFGPAGVIDGPAEVQRLDALIEGLRHAVTRLRVPDPWVEVQLIVQAEREMQRMARDDSEPRPRRRRRTRRR
jgi:hypothetical protein